MLSRATGNSIRLFGLVQALWPNVVAWTAGAGSFWIFVMMGLICADIASRGLFNHPIPGVPEFVAMSIVGCTFLQLGLAIRTGRLMRVEMVLRKAEEHVPTAARVFHLVFSLAGVFVFLEILLWAIPDFVDAYREGEFVGAEGAFTIPVVPFKAAFILGCALALVQFVVFVLSDIAALVSRRVAFDATAEASAGRESRAQVWLAILAFVGIIGGYIALNFLADLSPVQAGIISIFGMLLLLATGMPIAIALIVLSFIGIWLVRGSPVIAENSLGLAATGSIGTYQFAVIPLFVLMGLLVDLADVGRDAFAVAASLLRKLRGGLGVATVFANAIFAAITGSSIASAAVFTRVAVPQMAKHGYSRRFSVGVVAGSSVLGMLIPPSLLLIVYGLISEVSVGSLFIAAIIPGLMLSGAFIVGILMIGYLAPSFIGKTEQIDAVEQVSGRDILVNLLPILALVTMVIGGIYMGLFTPTESGAVGAFGALVIALLRGRLTFETLRRVLMETGQISASILFLMIAASLYSRMLTLSTIPMNVADYIGEAGFGMFGFLTLYILILIALGMILDSVSIILIVLPIMLPILATLGGDPLWFGIVTVIAVEIGLLTPPFGLSIYVVKGTLPDKFATLQDIFMGAAPFVLAMLAVTIVIAAFPAITRILV